MSNPCQESNLQKKIFSFFKPASCNILSPPQFKFLAPPLITTSVIPSLSAFGDCLVANIPACDATCAAEVAFPKVNWKTELACLGDISNAAEVIKIAICNGLGGICNVVAGMDPRKVAGLGEIITRMQNFNHRIAVAAAETPLRDLRIGYKCVICHPDIVNAMMATSEGINHAVRKRIENEVAKDINVGAHPLPNSSFSLPRSPTTANLPSPTLHISALSSATKDLLGSTVLGIAANKPDAIIYQCDKVLYLEVDAKAHRELEVLHRLGEHVYSRGCGTSFGLHTGPSFCLNLSAATLATFFKRSDLCSLPLSDAFVLFYDHATGAYSAKENGLPITAFSPTNTGQFELVEPQVIKEYVLGLVDAPTMVTPCDPTRANFCSQYIRFREPHRAEKFNEIGVLILRVAAQMLEHYAELLEDGPKDDSQKAQLTSVFGFGALELGS